MSEESLREIESQRFVKRESELDQKIRALRIDVAEENDPQKRAELKMDLQEAIQDREVLMISSDSTGAKKGELFGTEMRDMLDEVGLGRNESGELVCDNLEEMEGYHLMLVNMGELDRLNESGEHDMGDEGLQHAHYYIRGEILAAMAERPEYAGKDREELMEKFEIYRTAGNVFSLIFKDMPSDLMAEISKRLNGGMELPEEMKQEDIPLSAAYLSMKDSFDLLNHIRTAQGYEQVDANLRESAADGDKTEMITLLRERLLTLGDAEKINNRLQRILDKINNPSPEDTIDAQELYDKFLKKSLGNLFLQPGESGLQSFEAFKVSLQEAGLLADADGREMNDRQKQRRILSISQEKALQQFQVYNQNSVDEERALQQRVIQDFEDKAVGKGFDLRQHAGSVELAERAEYGEEQESATATFDERVKAIGEKTQGQRLIEQIRKELDEERAKVPAYKRLIKMREKELSFELLKRDQLTGLEKRGQYYQNLDRKIEEGKPISVIAIDMAFLKFFDKEGGRATGDKALSTAAMIMEHVTQKYQDVEAKAYRLGGDEFSLSVGTDKQEVLDEIINEIRAVAKDQVGAIPTQEGATTRYKPEALQFNFGTAVYNAEKHGINKNGHRDRKSPADKLNHEADSRIEVDKAVNRFMFLLQKSLEAAREESPEARQTAEADLEVLFSYSEKAIFGKLGREKIEEWTNEYKSRAIGLKKIMEELKVFVVEQLHEKGKKEVQDMEVMGIMMENQVLLDFKDREINLLKGQMIEVLGQGKDDRQRIKDLEIQLQSAEEDRRAVLSLRKRYKEAA